MTAGRKRGLKQWAKRVPGVRPARRRLLRSLRNSAGARSFVKQVFAADTSSPVPLDVAPGTVLGGVGTESLPVVLVVVIGADANTVEATIDEVAALQLLSAGFRPVIVTDTPTFAAVRRYGYPAELLIDAASWPSDHEATWDEYARERLALLFATYRATASVTLGPAGLDHAGRLVLSSLRPDSVSPVGP